MYISELYEKELQYYEYIRHGVVNIFMANEPLTGLRTVEIIQRKTKEDWAEFIRRIVDEMYPKEKNHISDGRV